MSAFPYGQDVTEKNGGFASENIPSQQVANQFVDGPVTGVYRGGDEVGYHSLERGYSAFGHHMRVVFPDAPQLDSVIVNQIDRARKRDGDRSVALLDLGAGTGNFTREFLVDHTVGEKIRRRLAGQTAGELLFYSVTDAPSQHDHLSIAPFLEADNGGNEKITAQQVEYSITSSQTIRELLHGIGRRSADIIVASNFMQYLRPELFRKVIQDTIDVLEPGGVFMAFGYATIVGRHLSMDDGFVEEEKPVVFQDPTEPDDQGISSDILRTDTEAILADTEITDEQLVKVLMDRIDTMFSSDYYSQPSLQDIRGLLKSSYSIRLQEGKSPRVLLADLLGDVLTYAELNERVIAMMREKDGILDELKDRNSKVASIRHNRIPDLDQPFEAIFIKKRIVGRQAIKAAR